MTIEELRLAVTDALVDDAWVNVRPSELTALLAVAEAAETLSIADAAQVARAELEDANAREAVFVTLCRAWNAFRAALAALKEA